MTEQIPIPTLKPMLRMISDEQVRELHYATLEILSQTGVKMADPQGRELLLEAGAWESNGRIKIPENLVTDAIDRAPSRIPMHNRLGEMSMPLELGKVFFGTGSDTTFTLDIETGDRRRSVAQDVEDIARLSDALENIDFVMSMGNPSDVPEDDLYVHSFIRMLRGSVKPNVYTSQNRADMEDIYRIAAATMGGEQALREKPILLHYAEPISPLYIIEESLQKHIFCAEKGIPAAYIPSPNTGGGGPITVAGAVALGNAECLLGLIITQLVNPGAPFLYGMNTAALDMKTTIVSYGSPDWSLGMGAWAELARYYNLPVWGYGGATDSKVVDAQAGLEATFSIMNAYLSRITLVHDVAYMEYGSTSSMELLVIADEIIRMTRFLMGGLPVNEETLALEAIQRVEPGAGFLADDHTMDHFRTAQWAPKIIDRNQYDIWREAGSNDMYTRANERAKEILAGHVVPALPKEAEKVIAEVLAERAE
ncbi:MAG: trimethylamine methyltransferase family protein [Anaerolineales bacterium]|nr:trimethylamine methyltransferase family protein [Chloroflexota bacterium]MBL6982624.1 trimethylamine methyltransferase family protein [Anaerolineales bacterium]